MREPAFWWREARPRRALLAPFAAVYGAVAGASPGRKRRGSAGVPVVCIGNLTVGGAGKTPTALAVARMLQAAGEPPVFLTPRLWRTRSPARCGSIRRSIARAMSATSRCCSRAPRRPSSRAIARRGRAGGGRGRRAASSSWTTASRIRRSPRISPFSSSTRGAASATAGSFPAGPLRAPLGAQLDRAHALIVVGDGDATPATVEADARARSIPVFGARLAPDAAFIAALGGGRVLAFAGIGDPEKFFATLRDAGIAVAATRSFRRPSSLHAGATRRRCARTPIARVSSW